jgi:hypothetical protein
MGYVVREEAFFSTNCPDSSEPRWKGRRAVYEQWMSSEILRESMVIRKRIDSSGS